MMGSLLLALALFALVVVASEVGARLGRRALARLPEGAPPPSTPHDAALLALLGLLVAFTFNAAATRFQESRVLVFREAEDLGTTLLRLDLLRAPQRSAARAAFRDYLDARLGFYRAVREGSDTDAAEQAIADRQADLWARCIEGVSAEGTSPSTSTVLLPAVTAMFDTAEERTLRLVTHPPGVIYGLLFVVATLTALLATYVRPKESHDRFALVVYAAVLAATLYVTLDLDHPRDGLFRIDDSDAALVDMRHQLD